jgi:hypothetical protein
MTEIVQKYIQEYWVIIAGIILFMLDPTRAKVLLSKLGVVSNPTVKTAGDNLDLVNELARANRDGGFGADEEIQGLYKKFSSNPQRVGK